VSHLTDVREQVEAWIDHLNQYSDFNYGNKRTVKIHNRHEPITTASDLAGMLYLPYTSYRSLRGIRAPPPRIPCRSVTGQVAPPALQRHRQSEVFA